MCCSSKRSFYGPQGSYGAFAGRDASRCLAKSSVDPKDAENPSLEGLSYGELESLQEWEQFFQQRYDVVGWFPPELKEAGNDTANSEQTKQTPQTAENSSTTS